MPSSPYWKLRRLAPRAIRVLERRKGESGAIAAYEHTLLPLAKEFISAYDDEANYEAGWRKEMEEGRGETANLVKLIQSWVPRLAADVPGFQAAAFGDRPHVPDDILGDAERLIEVIEEYKDNDNQPLAYHGAALQELEAAYQKAAKEWGEAEAADKRHQALLKKVREKGDAFDGELIAFRQTISAAWGRKDKDFQKLRASKASAPDEDDDPGAPRPMAEPPE